MSVSPGQDCLKEHAGLRTQSVFCGFDQCGLGDGFSADVPECPEKGAVSAAPAVVRPFEVRPAPWLDQCLKEPAWPRPVLSPSDSWSSLGGPPSFDDLPDLVAGCEPARRPASRRRWCCRRRFLDAFGPCMAVAIVVISMVTLGYIASTTGGHALTRECVLVDPSAPLEVARSFAICRGISLLLVVPPAVMLSALAATKHLRSIALYLWLTWASSITAALNAWTECAGHTDGVARLAKLAHSVGLPLLTVSRITVYMVLLLQRLRALEASSFRRLGVHTFRRWLLLGSVDWILCACAAALSLPLGFKGHQVADVVMGCMVWTTAAFGCMLIVMACLVMQHARAPLLAVCAKSEGHIAAEALRASRAMIIQMVGVVLGLAPLTSSTIAYFAWHGMLWPIPRSSLVAARMPIGVFSDIIGAIDVVGTVFAVMALGGCLSGALRATSKSQSRRAQRRQRWESSAAAWRSHGRELGAAWQEKVENMAGRGISLEEILRFYRSLGSKYMGHYDPSFHTTADVVWQAIIPATCESRTALSTLVMEGQHVRPHRMVTHNWGNLFHDLIAAIVADALGESEYAMVSYLLQRNMEKLEQWVRHAGKQSCVYWVCALCVNQHLSICGTSPEWRPPDPVTGEVPPACTCGLPKALNETAPVLPDGRSIPCEMNKFNDMIQFLSATDPHFEHVIAVDGDFCIFSRAWCVSEIAAANAMGMEQHLKLISAEGLAQHEGEMRRLRIQEMRASRREDKEAILAGISDVEAFNAHLRSLLFDDLICAWNNLDASEQMLRAGRLIRWQGVTHERRSIGLWQASEACFGGQVSLQVSEKAAGQNYSEAAVA